MHCHDGDDMFLSLYYECNESIIGYTWMSHVNLVFWYSVYLRDENVSMWVFIQYHLEVWKNNNNINVRVFRIKL